MKLTRRRFVKAGTLAALGARTAAAAPGRVRLVVLDVGGTIIQDRGDVPDAMQSAFAARGMKVTLEEIARWRGASKREVVRRFARERSSATGGDLDALIDAIYADFNRQAIEAYKDVPPIEGAEAAFRSLRQSGLLLAATTGFGREIVTSIFRRLEWEQYFAAVVSSDDVTEGRPAPFLIFHAMEAARVTTAAEVMVVGDTPLDLQAGMNAGARGIVGVLSGASTKERLEPEPHTDILSSVADLPKLIAAKY